MRSACTRDMCGMSLQSRGCAHTEAEACADASTDMSVAFLLDISVGWGGGLWALGRPLTCLFVLNLGDS
jgi:hypothetical protein